MVAMGHVWAGEARAAVLPHLDRTGTAQAELVRRMGVSKQAVQQLLDQLEADGVIERKPDSDDRRGRIITYGRAGRKFLADADIAKQAIEADYRAKLGEAGLRQLRDALRLLDEKT